MNHCNAVRVPIMMILGPRPPHIPLNPRSLAADPTVAPLALFIYETIVSAGCETIAQNTISKKTLLVNSPFPQISRNRKMNLIFLIPQGRKFDEELGTLIMNGPILTNQV